MPKAPSSIKGLPLVVRRNARCTFCGKELPVDQARVGMRHHQCKGLKKNA
jgi:hypothetical protein